MAMKSIFSTTRNEPSTVSLFSHICNAYLILGIHYQVERSREIIIKINLKGIRLENLNELHDQHHNCQ